MSRPGAFARRSRNARPFGLSAGEVRLTALAGVMLGLVAVQFAGSSMVPTGKAEAAGTGLTSGPVRVIDGDTFVHNGVRIRIADIDTPEVHGRCPYETALADRATARTRHLLAASDFELHPLPSGRDEDRYGRKLRIVTIGGRSVGDVLVAEGLARTWSGRREGWCG